MNNHEEPIYTPYVRHCLRFYARYPHIKDFRNETDKANWLACDKVIQGCTPLGKCIVAKVYGERDTIADNVYNASKQYGLNQDTIWQWVRKTERKIAIERGLL